MADLPTGTVTFLFTDIEGSTRLWESHPEAMKEALAGHDALLRRAIGDHGGQIFKTIGDAFCAVFGTANQAIQAAVEAQIGLRDIRVDGTSLMVRMALNTGQAEERDGDYFGPVLNRVARLLAAGHGGQVLVTMSTEQLAREALPTSVSFLDMGEHRLKDLQRPERFFQLTHPDLPAQFPPLRSLEAFAHNLPQQVSSFVGREKEIAEVRQLLGGSRCITVTGSGGCGKTRLALQVAADVVDDFEHGVWLVELANVTDRLLTSHAVAAALGIREEPGRHITDTLTTFLGPKQALLVLDNCEHLVEACAELGDRLLRACSKLKLLATSREALNIGGELTWKVPSLSLPDPDRLPAGGARRLSAISQYESVQLFVDRAMLNQPNFRLTDRNSQAVAQVCYQLDGIPLALELAAARVKSLSVEQVAERLGDRFRLLTGGSRTALPRQQTLRALIDWSFDLLEEPEQNLFARLAVFHGGFDLAAAEAVCCGDGIDEYDVLDLLARLSDKSLVVVDEHFSGEARYRLLHSVREYGIAKLEESESAETARRRHLEWYLGLVKQARPELQGSEQAKWLERLHLEHDNIRAALHWSLERAPFAATELTGAVWRFWLVRGYFTEGRKWLESVRSRFDGAGDLTREAMAARAETLDGAGWLAQTQGDYAVAHARLEESLASWRALGDQQGIATALDNLGSVAWSRGDYEAANRLYDEGLSLFKQMGDRKGIAIALNNLGNVAWARSDYGNAHDRYKESLAIEQELGNDPQARANALHNLGELAFIQGRLDEARGYYGESLTIERVLGNKRSIAFTHLGLGNIALALQDFLAAATHFGETLDVCNDLGDKWGIAYAVEGCARLAAAGEDHHRAARLFGAANGLRSAIGAPLLTSDTELYGAAVEAAKLALGEDGYDAAWREGALLTIEQVMEAALVVEEPNALE